MIEENFIKIYEKSFKENWDLPALTDYNTRETFTYGEVAEQIARLHLLFKYCQIRRGDKIALVGRNTPRWCIAFMAAVSYGAIIVPILQDFNANDVQHIVNHSDSVLLFAGDLIWENLEVDKLSQLRATISLVDYTCLDQRDGECITQCLGDMDKLFKKAYPKGFTRDDVRFAELTNDKVILINYTSGTTGFSKGVMLTGNNLGGNVCFGISSKLHFSGSKCLSFLPLAHAYGCAFDLLVPLAVGTHITLLGKIPSPKILLKALEEVKPNLIICVPLILEKIYRKQILPMLNKRPLKWALNVPLLDSRIYGQVRKKLVDAFGGRFEQVIVGGAPLNAEVEAFLYRIKFPFTVGYGMTECGPLISYTHHSEFIPRSSGRILEGYMQVKIDSSDPELIPGEICVRGENVMAGYYKNQEATEKVIDKDGWLHTGDMGTVNNDDTIFIKGRYKTMILGANGQNIYPEEIESKLNNMPFIMESLVIEKDGRLVALVYPDYEAVDDYGIANEDLPVAMEEIRKNLNKEVAPYEQIAKIHLYPTEFEKTPKRSIKRYLYTNFSPI
ncbi:AMP-binding protein [Coprobacter fastidiosus]|uniref:Long-chain acyl-CoA synthetase n=1 Tax=Coprobacter fastidiosus NSB1 = JCM 33896 TaxID=1349822 RepID=A0A495VKK2_9BACT|nr:AMP-binding protein [Coprobacter fastidiosus]ERM89911.1 long-chain fatty acid--CoA ligase [Coprobacter fastidiosus NSB1 = JCM 33896]RKT49782.1 long-chain acyl-CoA synthetase [Coprobacter fastidiosus NSB1 = JCM 33896]BEG63064.1 long-chain fatty acid--CoA ligase [Coprobacter fastidiosus]